MGVNYTVHFQINGEKREVVVKPSDTLLYVLRERLGLTGAKSGCNHGDCGTCTILVDGTPIKSCLMLAVEAIGKNITTIEGLHDTAIQKAFADKSAFQCGFCTPGFILTSYALTHEHPDANDEVVKEWLQSNLCRCTGYKEIEAAVKWVLRNKKH